MSKESDNKAIVGRWFTDFWGKTYNLAVVDQIAHRTCSCNIPCTSRAGGEMTSRPS